MTYSSAFLLVATAAVLAVSNNNVVNVVSALELTSDNFADVTAGKTVFIKFYAPWCGHCKAMADDWKQLEADFEGHEIALIGSVDCTSDKGDSICEEFSIDGFPTVAWGDSSSPETYEGGRDYASLKAFADQFVTKPVCSVFRLEVCSSEEKAQIEAIDAKTDQELLDQAETISKLAKKEEKNIRQGRRCDSRTIRNIDERIQ